MGGGRANKPTILKIAPAFARAAFSALSCTSQVIRLMLAGQALMKTVRYKKTQVVMRPQVKQEINLITKSYCAHLLSWCLKLWIPRVVIRPLPLLLGLQLSMVVAKTIHSAVTICRGTVRQSTLIIRR